jgi:SAM-dependent methyltransferase
MTYPHFQDEATAGAYERLLLRRIFEPWGRVLLDRAMIAEGARVLDVATGPGTIARMAAERAGGAGRIDGIDSSAQMLAEARAKPATPGAAPIEYAEAPADALPFAAGSFDVVLCQQGMQFFPDQPAAVREMRRVLRPGGRVAIAMWAHDRAMTLFVSFLAAFDAVKGGPPRKPLGWLDARRLAALLEDAGFADVKVEEETLFATFERGLPEALACVDGTSVAVGVRAMSSSERQAFDDNVTAALKQYEKAEGLVVPAAALVAVGRG